MAMVGIQGENWGEGGVDASCLIVISYVCLNHTHSCTPAASFRSNISYQPSDEERNYIGVVVFFF